MAIYTRLALFLLEYANGVLLACTTDMTAFVGQLCNILAMAG
jgi:hypothetical protein